MATSAGAGMDSESTCPGDGVSDRSSRDAAVAAMFDKLTSKQHEVLALVADNHTSKEIAWRLGISESAVNQRIEGVRNRAGFPPRAELARAYRQHVQGKAYKSLTGEIPQVPGGASLDHEIDQDETAGTFTLADPLPFRVAAPWQEVDADRIVPRVLDGPAGGLNRMVAMVVIAGGLLAVAMVGLGVAQALTTVF